jgi:hypothetical protein
VNTCPEDAAQLRHEMSLVRFFQVMPKEVIRKAELKACKGCGALFVPEPLAAKIGRTFTQEYLDFCPQCRKTNLADFYLRLSPWHRRAGKEGAASA